MEVLIARGESVHQLHNVEEFPSGQREQTVNLSSMTSVVRIHHLPPCYPNTIDAAGESARRSWVFLGFEGPNFSEISIDAEWRFSRESGI